MSLDEQLQAVYSELPTIACQRKCQDYCGPLIIPRVEFVNIELTGAVFDLRSMDHVDLSDKWKWMGKKKLVATPIEVCKMLYPNGKCRVYSHRPFICRIWGLINTPEMRCPHGCVPSRWLKDGEVRRFMERILAIKAS